MLLLTDLSDEIILEIFLRVPYTPANLQAMQQTCRLFHRITKTESLPMRTALYHFRPLMLLTICAQGTTSINWDQLRSMYPIISDELDLLDFLQCFTTAHREVVLLGIVLADFIITCRTTLYWTTQSTRVGLHDYFFFFRITQFILPPAAIMLLRFTSALIHQAMFLQHEGSKPEDGVKGTCLIDANKTNMLCVISFCNFEGNFLSRSSKIHKRSPGVWRRDGELYRTFGRQLHHCYENNIDPRLGQWMNIMWLAMHQALVRIARTGHPLTLLKHERLPVGQETNMTIKIAEEESLMHHLNEQIRGIFEDENTAFQTICGLDLKLIGQRIQEEIKTVSSLTASEANTALKAEVQSSGLYYWP